MARAAGECVEFGNSHATREPNVSQTVSARGRYRKKTVGAFQRDASKGAGKAVVSINMWHGSAHELSYPDAANPLRSPRIELLDMAAHDAGAQLRVLVLLREPFDIMRALTQSHGRQYSQSWTRGDRRTPTAAALCEQAEQLHLQLLTLRDTRFMCASYDRMPDDGAVLDRLLEGAVVDENGDPSWFESYARAHYASAPTNSSATESRLSAAAAHDASMRCFVDASEKLTTLCDVNNGKYMRERGTESGREGDAGRMAHAGRRRHRRPKPLPS